LWIDRSSIIILLGFTEASTGWVGYTIGGCRWCIVCTGVPVLLQTCLWLWTACQLVIWYITLCSEKSRRYMASRR